MTKIVYNAAYGGFYLNEEVTKLYTKITGIEPNIWDLEDNRTDPCLVRAVEEAKNSGDLEVAELPEGTLYRVEEYDGLEYVKPFDEYTWLIA